jgi:hypothetical protein
VPRHNRGKLVHERWTNLVQAFIIADVITVQHPKANTHGNSYLPHACSSSVTSRPLHHGCSLIHINASCPNLIYVCSTKAN